MLRQFNNLNVGFKKKLNDCHKIWDDSKCIHYYKLAKNTSNIYFYFLNKKTTQFKALSQKRITIPVKENILLDNLLI